MADNLDDSDGALQRLDVDPHAKDDNGDTALHHAAADKQWHQAQWLIAVGAQVTARNRLGQTPLHLACENGHLDVARLLVGNEETRQIHARDSSGHTPLYLSVWRGHGDVVKMLLTHGANPTIPCGTKALPIHVAAKYGHVEVVHVLLDHGVDANASVAGGPTPLYQAVLGGHREVVELLLNRGASVSESGGARRPITAVTQDTEILKWLHRAVDRSRAPVSQGDPKRVVTGADVRLPHRQPLGRES